MMKRGIIFTLIILMILSLLLQASGLSVVAQEEINNSFELYLPVIFSNIGGYPPIIPETTNVLTEDTTQYLTSVSSDGLTFTFSESTEELDSVSQGEIITSGVNSTTPDGFLRKVKSFNLSGGEVILVTEPATLEDAIQQGSIHISQELSPSMVQHAEQLPGVSLLSPLKEATQGSFHIEINDVVLYDEDGNDQTTNDRVIANGSITIEPSYSFDMDMHNWQLEQLQFDFNVTETSHLVVDSSVKVSVELIKKELARYPFAPATVMVGPLPVVITPVLTVNVGLDGFIEIGVSAGVVQEASLNAGVRYLNDDWNPSSSFENQFQHIAPTVFKNLGFKGYLGPELALMLYGIVGPQVEVNAYLKLESNPQVSPEWTLYGGLEVPIGVEFEIISKVIASFKVTAIKYEIILAQSSTSPGTTERVSVASDGTEANDRSSVPSISSDGRYVAFGSYASNLVSGDTNGIRDIFVHDRQTGETERVSVASDGTQGNYNSVNRSISSDGRYVAFQSYANNFVSGDTNGEPDIFVHDRQTGETERVSVASDGTQGNDHAVNASISGDGRYVAFQSYANNLVSGDTNEVSDFFVHDRQTGETERVSVASDGTQGNDRSDSNSPSISWDGRFVAFESDATNLVSGDTNGERDNFVHDRLTGTTERVSVASDGAQANNYCYWPSISSDGRYVAFGSYASNLVSGGSPNIKEVYVHDRQSGTTERVSVASDGAQANDFSWGPSISGDGHYVAFNSHASNLVSLDTNGEIDVFVHDRQTGTTERVSVANDGTEANDTSSRPSISNDGRYVALESYATNLVSGDTNGKLDIFVRDRGEGEINSWTLMYCLGGDNDLDSTYIPVFNRIEAVALCGVIAIVLPLSILLADI